jgi:hypothetical protein
MTIIIFELFSGIDPFPGSFGQIYLAKINDKKTAVPSDFPSDLKKLVTQGWSKGPKERPSIEEFKSAFNKMLSREEKDQSLTFQDNNNPKKKEEQLDFNEEVDSFKKTEEELSTNTKAGIPI